MNPRKKANIKILNRLASIVDQYPDLRFQQILIDFRITEVGKDKFYEESVETLNKLEYELGNKID